MQHDKTSRARITCWSAAFMMLLAALAGTAKAQEILPNDLVPAPAGTNAALGYYAYGHNTELNVAGGKTYKDNTGLEINLGVGRYVHYFNLSGMPAGWQVFQAFGSLSGAKVDGQGVGSAFGAANLGLGLFFWPYSNDATKTHVIISTYLYPPTGTYNRYAGINVGDNRWRGDALLGINQGVTDQVSFDASVDTMFYGNNNEPPVGARLSQNPSYRFQTFFNYAWNKSLVTSLGYEGTFGGDQQLDRVFSGSKTESHRARAVASYFWTSAFQTLLEINRDIEVKGGFKQAIGVQLRALYVF